MLGRFPSDKQLKNEMGVQYLMVGSTEAARETFAQVLAADPTNGFAASHLGFIMKTNAKREGDLEQGLLLMRQGIDSGEEGTRDGRFYYQLSDGLLNSGRQSEAADVIREGVSAGVFRSFYQRSLYNVDHLKAEPVWEKEDTGEAMGLLTLEKNWKQIRKEALEILKEQKYEAEKEGLLDKGEWGQFDLYLRGQKKVENCVRAPITCALIDMIPGIKGNRRGQVKFSRMASGTHINAHTGPTNCRLRAHLGLVVPPHSGELRMRVAEQMLTWHEGEVIVFDDSFEHEVWHDAKGDRIVLIADLWHPELSVKERAEMTAI